ncbi:MAG: preprotein translocase subunit SecY [Candidatus Yonathbacteria bacterium]|nr:preprotein translocase subunit SecY [Candidatus Yonathbacteria bacterium]
MKDILRKLKMVVRDRDLRNRTLFLAAAFIAFRALAVIPVPSIDTSKLSQFFSNNQFLGLLNIFSGGGLDNLSIVMLGVGPYITATIIMQLMTILSPKLKAMYHEEGEAGRRKFSQWSRMLTIPFAFIQGFGLLTILMRQGVIGSMSAGDMWLNLIIIAAGSVLLMWIGELISEFGIGNGVSLIIFAGIVASLPGAIAQLLFTFDVSQVPLYLGFLIAAVIVIAGVVLVTEAERSIPITYSKQIRGGKLYGGMTTYLPLRMNQAGVIPIIFALSILLLPQMIVNLISVISHPVVRSVVDAVNGFMNNGWVYGIAYFLLVFLFTYFYTAITFEPDTIATNLQKSGAFIPGIRPGKNTSEYLANIITRITFVGAIFLAFIAVLPIAMQGITGIKTLAIGGTGLLIIVSVVLDLVKKIDAQVAAREY